MKKIILLLLTAVTILAGKNAIAQSGDNCANATPFCTGTAYTYTNNTGVASLGGGGSYGCLGSTPNPVWYFLQIATPGSIDITLTQTSTGGSPIDVDFVLWGPFTSLTAACSGYGAGNIVDCSYSGSATEYINITGATTGQFYLLLMTNFSGVAGTMNFSQTGGGGTTNCAILCNMTALTAVPGACSPATGQYSVSGSISVTYPPTTGVLTVSSSCGGSVTYTPPFTSPVSYTIPGITATGGACSVTAVFSADPACTLTQPYTSPAPCNTCAVTASNTGPVCAGSTFNLGATNVAGASYSWTGPSGFSSGVQNPTGVTAPAAPGTYTYTVTATAGAATCTSTTTVTVNPIPVVNAEADVSACAGIAIPANTFTSTPAGATFTWTNSNTSSGLAASGSGSVPAFTGTNATGSPIISTITVIPTLAGCTGPAETYTITVNPQPTSTFSSSANQCLTGNSFNFTNTGSSGAGYTYSWTFAGGTPASSASNNATGVSFTTTGSHTITHVVTAPGGCSSTTTSNIVIYPMPTALTSTTVPATCGASNGSITITGVTGGTAAYTYSVDGSAFSGTTSYTGLAAGSHTIIVQDANGCTFTTAATVTTAAGPTALAVTSVNATCGASNGIINIGATTGGSAPYTYSVNGSSFAATTSYSGFAAGTYTVIVRDVNGCQFTTTVNVANTPGPTALATTVVNASCGLSNGTINIGATTGGTAPYVYSVAGSAFSSTTSYSGYAAGTYTVIVRDANNCTFTTTVTITNASGPTALVVNTTSASCGLSNGTVTIGAVTGGVPAYTYSFNGSAFSSTTNYTGVASGTYTVIVRDVNGCQFSTTATVNNASGPSALAVSSTNANCGASTGTVTIGAVTGGVAPYVYSFNGSGFTSTTSYPGLAAGTYTVIVRDVNNCTFSTTVTVTNIPGPTAQSITSVNSTCGAANGTITIGTTTGGTAPYLYSFNGSAFSGTLSYPGLAAGTYTVTVQDANGCSFTVNPIISGTPGPTALAVTTVPSTCGAANGAVNIGVTTGGTSPYTYSFNGGSFTSTTSYTGLTSGTYTITVKDANGCTFTVNPVVSNTAGPTALATSSTSSTCGGANGSITIGATTGGTAPYTYSFNGSPFSSTTIYTGLVANTYPVIVQDANGCQFTTSATVADLSGLTASITAQTNVSCFGGSNGTVTVSASGSTAPYSYSFNGGAFGASGTFGSLAAGTYTVTARDANNCTLPVTVTITQPPALSGSITAQTNVSCFGGSTGSVTVAGSAGTPGYMYSINGGAFGASATFNTLTAGTHTVTVRDANNCTFNITVTITQPPALTLTTSSSNATCTASNGSAAVTPAGGTPSYTYSWSAPAGASGAVNSGIPAGNYSVLVTDLNGCSQTAVVSVGITPGGPATISSSTNASCAGSNDGTATVSMGAGSTPPFTYSWTPTSQTTATAVNLAPAGYTVTVTDGNGCITTASVVITEPTVITNTFAMTPVSCFGGNNGTLTSTAGGGTGPYSYFWTPGGFTTPTITTLTAGTYTLVITDANGCTRTVSTSVTEPTGMSLSSTHVDANCNLANGSATVSVTGGTGPYTYLWNDPAAQTTATASGLPSNTYGVTVTDANGCTQLLPVTISDLAGPTASIFSSNNVSCNGDNDGSATVVVSGGTSPYTFSWSNGQTLPTATNLVANTYTVTATDVNGCIASTSVIITEPTLLDASIVVTHPTCFSSCNGSINSVAIGGVSPYTYVWSPGGATTPLISSLCAGTYTLQVTDANGCIVSKTGILTDPAPVTATTAATNITCSGLCNGTATANPSSGTGPFTYQWNDINAQTTQTATGLCAGSYTVVVTDANGCSANAFAIITSPGTLSSSITSSGNVTCFAACDGYASATVTGGSAPFSYMWMPGSTAGASVNNLCAATYTVTVTDANGCSASSTVVITEPVALVATISSVNVDCFGACNGTATAVYTGGTGPYTFQWSPTFQTTPTILNICAGVHDLAVTDANGCTATASVVITEPSALSVSTTSSNSNCGNPDGQACALISGGVPPFSYQWNDPAMQTTSCANSINAGVYTISVTDGNGCSVTGVANVNDNTAPVVTIVSSNDVTCGGASNGDAQANITGGILPYNISWTPGGQTTAFISGLSGGIHSVVVTDSVGCVGTASVTINEPAPLVSGITASSNVSCFLSCDGSATVNAGGGTAPYTYLWNDAATQTTSAATGLCAQGYTVTVTDANGCATTSSTTITQPPALNITLLNSVNVSCNSGNNGSITLNVSGGSPGYTYLWTPGVGSGPMVTGLIAGTYSVTVTDQNGCTAGMSFNITQPTPLSLSTISNSSTCGDSNGSVSVTPAGGVPAYLYQWNDPSNQTTAIATNLAAGTYTVVVTDQNGCTADTAVVLNDLAGPTISGFTFTEPLCHEFANGSATVLPVGGQPAYSFLWTGVGAQTTQTASALPAGTYSVTVTDANGCQVTGSVIVTQPSATQVIVSPTDTICIGQNAQVYGAGYGGTPGYTYTWAPAFLGAGPHTVTPVVTTFYNVFVTDANGCVSPTMTTTVFVNPALTVNATDVSVCDGSSVLISANATGGNGGPYTYTWSNAVSGSSQTVSPGISSSPEDYIVTVDDGCSFLASDTATVTVNPQAVSFMTVNDTAGCEDFTVTFTGLSNIGITYEWNFGDGSATQTGINVTHTYVTPGVYDVTLNVTTAQGCISTISSNNYIDVLPAPVAAFSSSPATVTSTSPTVTFTNLSLGATDWNWDFINQSPFTGLYTDTLQNPTFTYADTGTYSVQLIVTNGFGCADTAYNFVEVIPEYVFYAPNAFTPLNHDGLNDLFMPQGIGMHPDSFEMTIYDRWGNQIYKTTELDKGWDGRANGGDKIAQIDVYVWKVVTKDFKGDQHEYFGHVTLVK